MTSSRGINAAMRSLLDALGLFFSMPLALGSINTIMAIINNAENIFCQSMCDVP